MADGQTVFPDGILMDIMADNGEIHGQFVYQLQQYNRKLQISWTKNYVGGMSQGTHMDLQRRISEDIKTIHEYEFY